MRQGVSDLQCLQDIDECSEISQRMHDEIYRVVAVDADILVDLQSRVIDWKNHKVEEFGRLLQYEPLVRAGGRTTKSPIS